MRPWRPPELPLVGGVAASILLSAGGELQEEHIRWDPCYRVIATEYAGENLFDRLVDEQDLIKRQTQLEMAQQIADLTNPVIQDRLGEIELVPLRDRIYGPGTGLIMAAFTYPTNPSRFSNGEFGAYYATNDRDTAIAESSYHAANSLRGSGPCVVEKSVIEAVLDATLVDVRQGCPSPPGIYDLEDYSTGQALGELVRKLDGYGIVYDSMRRAAGECAAVFRPPALRNAQAVQTILFDWNGEEIVGVR
jgi:hypothetical protein